MTPRQIDRNKRQREIAQIALHVFATHGFETTSISQIAEACQIGKATIYEYFASKEELIMYALAVWGEQLEQDVKQLVGNIKDPIQRLYTYVDTLIERFLSDEPLVGLFFHLFPMLTKKEFRGHHTIREMFQGVHQFLTDVLLDGISQGTFSPKIARDVQKIAINMTAYLDGIILHYYASDGAFELKEQCHSFLDLWLTGNQGNTSTV